MLPGAPLNIQIAYVILRWLDRLANRLQCFAGYRFTLQERYCQCEKCQRRKQEGI